VNATIPSLLITDDDRDFRETLQGVFEPQGFRTLLAGDGEEALKIVRSEEVHLLLLDMHMPKLTGLETLRRVKQIKAILPCILISANLDEVLIEQAQRAQAFSVLAKPVSRVNITNIVMTALRRTYNWPA
jgi:CheY-like chemotaxis protein